MAYVNSVDLPLYFSALEANSQANPSTRKAVAATNISLTTTPSLATVKLLGKDSREEDVHMSGPPSTTLSFSMVLEDSTNSFNPFDYTGVTQNTDNLTTCTIGNITSSSISSSTNANKIRLSGLFLTNFSLNITPYAPVTANVEFACYYPPVGGDGQGLSSARLVALAGSRTTARPVFEQKDVVHGYYSNLTTLGFSGPTNFENVTYTYNAAFQPTYELGSFNPTVRRISAEQSLAIQTDQPEGFLPASGLTRSTSLVLRDAQNAVYHTAHFNSAVANSQSFNIGAGDAARVAISLLQPLK